MDKGTRVMALIGGKWVQGTYEKPLTGRGREGQHLVMVSEVHHAIAQEVKPACEHCGHELEMAEYLETESGLASAPVCMNEECEGPGDADLVPVEFDETDRIVLGKGKPLTPALCELHNQAEKEVESEIAFLRIGLGWTEEQTAENLAFLRKLSPHIMEAVLVDLRKQAEKLV